ncbi:ABC transporter ATP-binding protein [Schaalia sp. lx-260]|uniref:ABC transporter ATP-binding protein n=1 Tax=Schaalia sp. lx-260 TaxID=2899082 RepID=UPI001E4E491D|nr:ABC transporter ATP-binding protein [Schaalia sp. lx-260]MCD4550006.1 ABC transporter ATP-binding protein [Schaalia sp. lx-260]
MSHPSNQVPEKTADTQVFTSRICAASSGNESFGLVDSHDAAGETEGLVLESVSVRYGSLTAVDHVSMTVPAGCIVALVGASGSGKSSLLRAIAGLEPVATGDIYWQGRSVVNVPVHRRGFGVMFQDGQLFPHRNVAGNVAYGLRHMTREQRRERVLEVLRIVGMEQYAHRQISTLSGGQAQRVALARSLAPQPQVILLDEPLSALDRALREHLCADIRRILRETHSTGVYVTHDQDEAFALADYVAVMREGQVIAYKPPAQLWANPDRKDVAEFLGYGPHIPLFPHALPQHHAAESTSCSHKGTGDISDSQPTYWRALSPVACRIVGLADTCEGTKVCISHADIREILSQATRNLTEDTVYIQGVVLSVRTARGYFLSEVRVGDVVIRTENPLRSETEGLCISAQVSGTDISQPQQSQHVLSVGSSVVISIDVRQCPVVVGD